MTIEQILNQLDSDEPQEAWAQFLQQYSGHIFQVIRHFEKDADRSADCFQFICEQLIKNRSSRLRKFKGEGVATFTTWLHAVVHNLCVDWHRREFGRNRPFHSISLLSHFDQEVFRLIYEWGFSPEESLPMLAAGFPDVTSERLIQSQERIENRLTKDQRWILARRKARKPSGEALTRDEPESLIAQVPDPRPDPEAQAVFNERQKRLKRALGELTSQERLLIFLRYEQELTLDQLAKVLALGNAQRTDRRLKEILARLRKEMG